MRMRIVSVVCLIVVFVATAAEAQSLKREQEKQRQENDLAKEVTVLNKTCETQVTAMFDWPTVPDNQTDMAANFCIHALDATAKICVDSLGKDAVRKQVTNIKCSYAEQRSVSLQGGVLEFRSDFKASDDRSTIVEYLQGNL
jgi:hypothetical protein